ncbi:CLUMA_CG018012, isoform A [Clunio marinus]|uniref:18S rRNA (pseudouridine-N1)-methyltransferase n=1 Tax=Clunio marinus TaxID=568069 RepID=A0A1J1J158_9DIPT|nr:CLUMA_CG018012, isoform A [Clunio marinus]
MGKRKRGDVKPKVEGEYDLPPKHTKAVHVESNKKRLIVILHGAQLETVKVGNTFELLNCDDHLQILKKYNRDPGSCRPDITHQSLLMLMDSPLNRAGMLQVYIKTEKNVLIEINPQTRIPRTFKRFAGLMVQLLHKFSVRANETSVRLLHVIKNPVTDHLPVGCKKITMSFSSKVVKNCRELVPAGDEAIAMVIGAFAHGNLEVDYTEEAISISNYPLSAALTCTKLCSAFEEVWGVFVYDRCDSSTEEMFLKFSFVFNLFLSILIVDGQLEGDSCVRKYDNSPGICRSVRRCPKVREDYNYGVPLTICSYLNGEPTVCCPLTDVASGGSVWSSRPNSNSLNDNRRISEIKCEEYAELTKEKVYINGLSLLTQNQVLSLTKCDTTVPLIVGGEKTKKGEYPHMAAIGWRTYDGSLEFKCGGSLISERFVLTAAHCSRADGLAPSFVRLGDQNIKSRTDGLVEVDIAIAEFIAHEDYRRSSFYNDIALIKMAQRVDFTKYIRPACLWQTININTTKTIATGWGYTETAGRSSNELMKVELNIINNIQCNRYFTESKLGRGIINSQVCAGVLSGSKDTCNGDSGGPIQVTTPVNKCLFHIIGVTSFGSPFCGLRNSPGVYTRVSSFLDWIEEKVWR